MTATSGYISREIALEEFHRTKFEKLVHNIFDALDLGLGAAPVLSAVQDIAELQAIDTTSATNFPDKILIHVEDNGLYRLDRQSGQAPDTDRIVQATVGVGRWIKMASPLGDHNVMSLIQGGLSDERYHLTLAELGDVQAIDSVFTAAEKTKLGGIEALATVDQSDAEIKTAYENNADTNAFTDAEQTKLGGIEANAKDDQSAAELPYDNSGSGLAATEVQAAIDELKTITDSLGGGAISSQVADQTALEAIDTTLAADFPDGILITVRTLGIYRFDRTSATAADTDRIVDPTTGPGRWFKTTGLTSDHNDLSLVQGGVSGQRNHLSNAELVDIQAIDSVFTAAEKTKLTGIEALATVDQSDAEIKTAYENNADTNAFTDAEQTKLGGIEALATVDQTAGEIKTAYESNADTNEFTDAEKLSVGDHGADHINGGAQEIDGDRLDITFTPTNYTPTTVPAEATSVDDLTAHLAGIDNALPPAIKEVFYTAGATAGTTGDYSGTSIAANGSGNFSFFIPADFTSLTSLELVAIPSSTNATADIDLNSDYAAVGEDAQLNSETDAASTFAFTANQTAAVDISSVFSSIAASDYCGLDVDHNGIGGTVVYLGIKLRYT